MKVFWLGSGSGSGSGHVTLPIRRLVDASVQLVEKPGYQDSEVCVHLLYSGKLSREKTFANFEVL